MTTESDGKSKPKNKAPIRHISEENLTAGLDAGSRAQTDMDGVALSSNGNGYPVHPLAAAYAHLALKPCTAEGGLNMPAHRTTQGLRESTVLHAQRKHGNIFVQRQLVQLEEAEDNAPLETEGLGKQEELQGHGNLNGPVVQREGPGTTPPTTAPTAAPSPTATITLTINAPTIVRETEATISTNHGATGVAGWCTPGYNVAVTGRSATTLALTVTLDFTIELASEYTGDRLAVLSDHENGHVRIGERLARQHLDTNLKNNLQALPDFRTAPSIQTQIVNATTAFTTAEGQESRAYDTADYPRMREAYFGARTPLADLASASAPVQAMIDALRAFDTYVNGLTATGTDETGLATATQTIIRARAALSQDDVHRLQYNPEFKALVATAQSHAAGMRAHVDETSGVDLHEVDLVLASFTWSPSV